MWQRLRWQRGGGGHVGSGGEKEGVGDEDYGVAARRRVWRQCWRRGGVGGEEEEGLVVAGGGGGEEEEEGVLVLAVG